MKKMILLAITGLLSLQAHAEMLTHTTKCVDIEKKPIIELTFGYDQKTDEKVIYKVIYKGLDQTKNLVLAQTIEELDYNFLLLLKPEDEESVLWFNINPYNGRGHSKSTYTYAFLSLHHFDAPDLVCKTDSFFYFKRQGSRWNKPSDQKQKWPVAPLIEQVPQ